MLLRPSLISISAVAPAGSSDRNVDKSRAELSREEDAGERETGLRRW